MVSVEGRASGLRLKTDASERLLARARRVAPGGIQGDGRWTEPFPIFLRRAQGARVWDVDGNEYIDYWASAGPSVLGHNDSRVREAVVEALETEGVLFTTPHPREVELAELFADIVPCAEKTAFCGGGASDAMYNAVRVSRAYTGRTKIVKFEGGYHGWHDDVAVSVRPRLEDAGPADAPHAVPVSAGALPEVIDRVIVAPYHDRAAVERIFEREKGAIAALIVEPVSHSVGCLVLDEDFVQFLRDICTKHGVVLIFDEVITGFRHHIGGVQALFGVTPDLGVFGKAMANGYTISALAGRNEIMSMFMPEGPVMLSGTYMGNLLGVTASLKTIELLRDGTIHEELWRLGKKTSDGINAVIDDLGVKARCVSYGGFWSLYFVPTVRNYRDIATAETYAKDQAYREALLNNGIYVQGGHAGSTRPSRAFISAAHTDADIERTIEVTAHYLGEHREELR